MSLLAALSLTLFSCDKNKTYAEYLEDERDIYHDINIEIQNIEDIIPYIKEHKNLKGFNVTIPYKEEIIINHFNTDYNKN